MRYRPLFGLIWILAATTLLAHQAQAEKIYRWTDEQGRSHYGDRLPAGATQRPYTILSEQGLVLRHVEPKTEKKQPASDPATERYQTLKQTYGSVAAIKATRDSHLAAIDGNLRIMRKQLANRRQRLAELQTYALDEQETPAAVREEMAKLRTSITDMEDAIADKRAERARLRKRYEQDLEDFRKLKPEDTEQD